MSRWAGGVWVGGVGKGGVRPAPSDDASIHVSASRAGVELACDPEPTLTPLEARWLARLLERAADDAEAMASAPS